MDSLVHAMLSNAVAVTVLAVLVAGLARACRRPALIHGLWLVVMLKLVTPPVVPVFLPVFSGVVPASTFSAEIRGDRGMEPKAPVESSLDPEEGTTEEPRFADITLGDRPTEPGVAPADGLSDVGTEGLAGTLTPRPSIIPSLPAGWKWEPIVLVVVFSGAFAWWALATLRIISVSAPAARGSAGMP